MLKSPAILTTSMIISLIGISKFYNRYQQRLLSSLWVLTFLHILNLYNFKISPLLSSDQIPRNKHLCSEVAAERFRLCLTTELIKVFMSGIAEITTVSYVISDLNGIYLLT